MHGNPFPTRESNPKHQAEALRNHASAIVGTTARLRCRIDGRSCGAMHSIKWYKSESRLYVYSISGNTAIDRPEGPMKDRLVVVVVICNDFF
ncbi:hypothetical protein SFRURICE_016067 [Spodoptera frugiperda]|nr:hypothetical protein SFRURICE_016067 [Spodoptera frugiperda]